MNPVTPARYVCEVRCRRCRECEHVFRPSSGHLRCPACRSKSVCACGRSKQLKSATCSDGRSVAAEANGNWKGGRTRHKAGYVMVRAPDHPRATSGPYVFEHILVAEDLLGRFLHDGETFIIGTAFDTTIVPRTSSCGRPPSHQASGSVMPSHGRARFSNSTRALVHLQQSSHCRVRTLGGGGGRTDLGGNVYAEVRCPLHPLNRETWCPSVAGIDRH